MSLYSTIIETLALLGLVGTAAALVLLAVLVREGGRMWVRRTFGDAAWWPLAAAWVVALTAMTGSLYLSDVVGFPPCVLCWYQRIAMYPLVFVLGMGLVRRSIDVWYYALPLPVVGLLVSAYHVALQYQPALDVVSCDASAPCTGRYVAVFGFVSIPVLAGAAFVMIIALLLAARVAGGGRGPETRNSTPEA